jgi:hypothetical protein
MSASSDSSDQVVEPAAQRWGNTQRDSGRKESMERPNSCKAGYGRRVRSRGRKQERRGGRGRERLLGGLVRVADEDAEDGADAGE